MIYINKLFLKKCAAILAAAALISASGCAQSNTNQTDGSSYLPKAETNGGGEAVESSVEPVTPKSETDDTTGTTATTAAKENAAAAKKNAADKKDTTATTKTEKPSSLNGQEVVNYAMKYRGTPYVYSGNSLTKGIDCSGFTKEVFAHFGISLPRTAAAQDKLGSVIPYADALPGDLCTTTYASGSKYTGHAAIYIGNGQVINALPGEGVVVTELYTLYGDYTFHRLYNNTAPKKSNNVINKADNYIDDDDSYDYDGYDNYDEYEDNQEEFVEDSVVEDSVEEIEVQVIMENE